MSLKTAGRQRGVTCNLSAIKKQDQVILLLNLIKAALCSEPLFPSITVSVLALALNGQYHCEHVRGYLDT